MKLFALIAIGLLTSTVVSADESAKPKPGLQLTDEQTEALIQRAMEESAVEDDDCSNKTLTSCIGVTRSQCQLLRNSVVSECTMPLARKILSADGELTRNIELEHTKCTLELAETTFSIDPATYMSCMPAGTYQHSEAITEWLETR